MNRPAAPRPRRRPPTRGIAALGLTTALAFALAATPAGGQAFDPDAPVPAGAILTTLDLQFRTEPLAGAIQALEVRESATEIRIDLAADVLFETSSPATRRGTRSSWRAT